MSYIFDGKISNQCPKIKNFSEAKVLCEKCNRLVDSPKRFFIELENKVFLTFSYLGTQHSIYETKRGTSVVYCSDFCKRKHNHRFI